MLLLQDFHLHCVLLTQPARALHAIEPSANNRCKTSPVIRTSKKMHIDMVCILFYKRHTYMS